MAREVRDVRQAPAEQALHLLACHRGRPERVAVRSVVDLLRRDRRCDDQVKVVEHALHGVDDLGAHLLVSIVVDHRRDLTALDPDTEFRRQILAVIAHEVEALGLQILEGQHAERDDQATPELYQLAMSALDADIHLLDVRAGLLEDRDRATDAVGDGGIDGEDAAPVRAVGDAHALDRAARGRREVGLLVEAERIARVIARECGQDQRGVRNCAGDRALGDERRRAPERVRPDDHRYPPERALEAIDPAPCRRDADRAASVGAFREGNEAVGHGRRAAARRTAGVLAEIERIARWAEQRVVADSAEAHHRAVGLAEEDPAGALDALGEDAVVVGHEVLEGAHAAERARPAGFVVEQVLHGRRHAVQRAELGAGHDRLLGCARSLARILEAEVDEGVEIGIARLDARDRRVDGLDRRQLTRADAKRGLAGGQVRELVRVTHCDASPFRLMGVLRCPLRVRFRASGSPPATRAGPGSRVRPSPPSGPRLAPASPRRLRPARPTDLR